jgi:ABC-2 type transport system ATP-binding protein
VTVARRSSSLRTTWRKQEADVLSDRIAIIDHGRIVAEGTSDELKRAVAGDVVTLGVRGDPQDAVRLLATQPFVRASDPPAPESSAIRVYVDEGESAIPRILRVLEQGGLGTETISLTRPSLDDVFLRQTGRSLREEAA